MQSESQQTPSKPDCIVVDTNYWRSEYLFNTPLGAALLYFLHRRNARLGLPEVIETEIPKQIIEAGLAAVEAIEKNLGILAILTGSRPKWDMPAADQLVEIVKRRLAEFAPLLVRVPFTFEHAKAALEMVNAGLPPNSKNNQQFKDSAIWRALLDLGREHTVHFVTNDRAFMRGKDSSEGLAHNLLEESQRAGVTVTIHHDLGGFLKKYSEGVPPLDQAQLAAAVDALIRPRVERSAGDREFVLADITASSVSVFATERNNVLALDFEIIYKLDELGTGGDRRDGSVIAKGSCYYDLAHQQARDEVLASEQFDWTNEQGLLERARVLYASGSNNLAFQQTTYTIRKPVP